MPEITPAEWDRLLSSCPDAHILQTRSWGELKGAFGWKPVHIYRPTGPEYGPVAAMVLFRRLPLGLSIGYAAKGPVQIEPGEAPQAFWKAFCSELDPICRRERAVFLRVEPDAWEPPACDPADNPHPFFAPPNGFVNGAHSIQPKQTILVDLSGSEEDILRRMKQKTRYNIRLAQKKGVRVAASLAIDEFYNLLKRTGDRDAFGVHQKDYYSSLLELFSDDQCQLLMAEYEGAPLAGLMVFRRGERAWYLYGASGDDHRDLMPAYLLQWEAMRWARQQGCRTYDLWGIPDAPLAELEQDFTSRSDGLWGVYRFKRGFGGQLFRAAGPWDRVYNQPVYRLYNGWIRSRSESQHGD